MIMQPNDLQAHFPSLFVALDYLKEDPYEAGWLLGNISDVALIFATRLVLGDVSGDDATHLADIYTRANEYLKVSSTSQQDAEQSPINVEELVNVVQ